MAPNPERPLVDGLTEASAQVSSATVEAAVVMRLSEKAVGPRCNADWGVDKGEVGFSRTIAPTFVGG